MVEKNHQKKSIIIFNTNKRRMRQQQQLNKEYSSKESRNMQRHSYKFYLDKAIESAQVKMQKLSLYISLSDEDLPMIPIRQQYLHQFVTQTRMYFNDKELLIYKNPDTRESYLQLQEFQTIITEILSKKLDKKKSYEEINFIDVIEKWITNDPLIQVFYPVYEEVVKASVSEYLGEVEKIAVNKLFIQKSKRSKVNLQSEVKEHNNNKNVIKKPQSLRISTEQNQTISMQMLSPKNYPISTTSQNQPLDTFTHYLKQFFTHYAKKSPNIGKLQQFEKLEQFYTTINLNKFMLYCKQIGLLKVNKKVSVNFVKKLFTDNKNEKHVVEFDGFAKLVTIILAKIFKTQEQIIEKGYELIGVKDRKNFVQTMAKVGVLVPLKKIFFTKMENKKQRRVNLELLEKLKEKQKEQQQRSVSKQPTRQIKKNDSLSKLQKHNLLHSGTNNGGYPNQLKPPTKQQLFKSSSMNSLPTIYSSHQGLKEDKKLQELLELDVENEDDPYLSRFNDQQRRYESERDKQKQRYNNKEEQLQKSDKNNWGQGVMERMDKRMNNVVRKMW